MKKHIIQITFADFRLRLVKDSGVRLFVPELRELHQHVQRGARAIHAITSAWVPEVLETDPHNLFTIVDLEERVGLEDFSPFVRFYQHLSTTPTHADGRFTSREWHGVAVERGHPNPYQAQIALELFWYQQAQHIKEQLCPSA